LELGMIGLGRMGSNMALRLLGGGHRVVGYDQVEELRGDIEESGGEIALSLPQLVNALPTPRVIWLMLPQGEPVDSTIDSLLPLLSAGDTLIDGGNSHYRDSQRRALKLRNQDIILLDVGTSGGIWGLRDGYCLMIGGERSAYQRLEPLFETLTGRPGQGYAYLGPSGAGHFAKMVHNGIEYALMEAYAEGFALLAAKEEFDFDLARVAETWRSGSVVRSWLLDLTAKALAEQPGLEGIAPYVEDTGEGRWALSEAIDLGVPVPAIATALLTRLRSRQGSPFAERLLAALRQQFGGHPVRLP
jgi:6-phosphogluconate dehydrogenase